eukprot:m.60066 g.60066  ORF g.60066 m.60066 type:complete len:612 (+) comp13834_c0_seq1:79-1914(+)
MQQLDSETVRKLGSYQVITSIEAAIKELVENSLDSGANTISVKLVHNGLKSIAVSDDGCGIDASSIPLAAKPHFTSKITSFDDLTQLQSLGFRGEALASLAECGDLTMTTAIMGEPAARTYTFDSQGNPSVAKLEARSSTGTTTTCYNMFKRMPVRRKHADTVKVKRKCLTQAQHLCQAYSLANPGLQLTFENDKQPAVRWRKRACQTSLEAVGLLFGTPLAKNLHQLCIATEHGTMTAWVAAASATPSVVARSQADRSFILVNKRVVDLPSFYSSYKQAWTAYTQSTSYPFLLLEMALPENQVDVNMSADKRECLITAADVLLAAFNEALGTYYDASQAVDQSLPTSKPVMSRASTKLASRPTTQSGSTTEALTSSPILSAMPARKRVKAGTTKLQQSMLGCCWAWSSHHPSNMAQGLRLIGHLEDGTWLCTDSRAVFAFDLQRARESQLYDRLLITGTLPRCALTTSLALDRTQIGAEGWSYLASLATEPDPKHENMQLISDPRICSNGFLLQRTKQEPMAVYVLEMASSLFFSPRDLSALLQACIVNKSPRPRLPKAREYFKGEASRIAAHESSTPTFKTVQGLLESHPDCAHQVFDCSDLKSLECAF